MKRLLISTVLLAALSAAAANAQQVYRWTDEQGRVHYSNVGPSGEATDASSSPAQSAPATEESRPAPPSGSEERRSAGKKEEETRYSKLSGDEFSARATRERLSLKRDLADQKRRVGEIDGELADLRNKRDEVLADAAQRLQGVSRPEFYVSPREEELQKGRKEAEERMKEIRDRYAELKKEAEKRHGGLPQWWLPLE